MADESTPTPSIQRPDDLFSTYANNISYETSFWDLKLLFGQIDQSVQPLVTRQRAAVTLPWAQVKLLIYFLRVNLLFHEEQNGGIPLRRDVLPPDPTSALTAAEMTPDVKAVIERMKAIYDDLITKTQIRG